MYRGQNCANCGNAGLRKKPPDPSAVTFLPWGLPMFGHRAGDVQLGAGTGDNDSSDLLWHDNNTGTVAIWLLDGLQALQTGSLGAVPSNWLIATTGDYLKA